MAGFDRLRELTSQATDKAVLIALVSVALLPVLGIVGYLGYEVYSAVIGDKDSEKFIGKLIGVAIVGVIISLVRGAFSSSQSKPTPARATADSVQATKPLPRLPPVASLIWIETNLEQLYESMYGDRRPEEDKDFLQTLPLSLLNGLDDEFELPLPAIESATRTLIQNTRSRIGSLDVPLRKVNVEYAANARFPNNEPAHIEFGNWSSTIRIDYSFREEPFGMCSILCHELAHFILDQNGIRKSDKKENERFTDLFVFACGQGRISLGGILCQRDGSVGKFGYLSLEEMAWAFVRSASHRGLSAETILAACLDREIARYVRRTIDFLTVKENGKPVLAEIVICPEKHVLRRSPQRRSIKCPKCGWKSEVWNRRDDERAHLVRVGQEAFDRGNYDGALEYLRKAQTLAPRHSLSYCVAAQCLKKLGRHQDAIREIRKVLTISPNDEVAKAAMNNLLYL